MKHEITIISIKQNRHRALKDISEALEQKLYSSKDISEAHRVVYQKSKLCMAISKGVYSKDDCGKLKAKTQIKQDAPSKTLIMW